MKKFLVAALLLGYGQYAQAANNKLHNAVDKLEMEDVQQILDENPAALTPSESIRTIERIKENKRNNMRSRLIYGFLGGAGAGALVGALSFAIPRVKTEMRLAATAAFGLVGSLAGGAIAAATFDKKKYRMLTAIFATPLSDGQIKILGL